MLVRVPSSRGELPAPVLVVATNCNGGVKEVLCFDELPDRLALWHARCPENRDSDNAAAGGCSAETRKA